MPPRSCRASAAPADLTDHARPVSFLQDNPKKRNSAASCRYEGYKRSKTIGEALQAGAALGDLKYDLAKGFMQLDSPAAPKRRAPPRGGRDVEAQVSAVPESFSMPDATLIQAYQQATDDAVHASRTPGSSAVARKIALAEEYEQELQRRGLLRSHVDSEALGSGAPPAVHQDNTCHDLPAAPAGVEHEETDRHLVAGERGNSRASIATEMPSSQEDVAVQHTSENSQEGSVSAERCMICLAVCRCAHIAPHGQAASRCGPHPVCVRCATRVVEGRSGQFKCPICKKQLGPLRRAMQEGGEIFQWEEMQEAVCSSATPARRRLRKLSSMSSGSETPASRKSTISNATEEIPDDVILIGSSPEARPIQMNRPLMWEFPEDGGSD